MDYFITGGTGFIGRYLIERLLKRDGTVYVLVREGSRGRLEEMRSGWGGDGERVVPVIGDLNQPISVSTPTGSPSSGARSTPSTTCRDLRHGSQRGSDPDRQHRGNDQRGRPRQPA